MDIENKSEVVNEESEVVEEIDNDVDHDDWDDITWDDLDDNKSEESENDSETEAEPEEDEHEEEADDTDQWIELKHMDDPIRKVSKEEAKSLALKGLDYDRIREERDTMKSDLPRYKEMEKFLGELKGDFNSVEDLMDDTRARVLMNDDNKLSYDEAISKARANRMAKNNNQTKKEDSSPVDEFVKKYPKVKSEDIPDSVWAEVRETGNLVGAYETYLSNQKEDEIKKLKDEIEILKKNNKNSARSTGSRKSSGSSKNTEFDNLWYDGT